MTKHWIELGILIACLIFSAFISALLMGMSGLTVGDSTTQTSTYLLSAIITQIIMFIGAAVLFFSVTRIKWKQYIVFGRLTRQQLLLTVLVFSGCLIATFAFAPIAEWMQDTFKDHPWVLYQAELTQGQSEVLGSLRGLKIVLALIVFAMLPAIAEEILFRGLLYKILVGITTKKQLSMVLSAIIFAAFHFQVLSFIPIMLAGYLLAFLYSKTQNIFTCMLFHFLFNAIQIVFWQA